MFSSSLGLARNLGRRAKLGGALLGDQITAAWHDGMSFVDVITWRQKLGEGKQNVWVPGREEPARRRVLFPLLHAELRTFFCVKQRK